MLDASLAVLGVCAQDDFGVTPRPESVALRLELRPEAAEVVDLAVEDDHERSPRVGHRLRSRAEVDDRESRHPEGRSEEHTSELQSLTNLVCRLLLEKKKQCNQ